MRWLAIALLIIAPLASFMTWRTFDLIAPQPQVIVATPPSRAAAIDSAGAARRLATAIAFKTFAGPDGEPLDPEPFRKLTEWLGVTYPALSAVAKREQINEYSLLYTWTGSDPTSPAILLIGHLDVPAPDPAPGGANAALFSGAMRGDAVWGRGAQLGKSPLVAMFEAANALAAHGFKPRRTIIIALGQDGNVSGQAGAAQIAQVLEGRKIKAWFALEEGAPIVAKSALTQKPAAMIGITEKRQLNLIVTAKSAGGAASFSGGEGQAVTSLAQAVVAIDAMPKSASLSDQPTRDMIRAAAHDLPFSRAFLIANSWLFEPLILMQIRDTPGAEDLLSTTVSPTVIEGGANQLLRPSEASATVNVRLHPRDAPARFLARARDVASAFPGVSVDWADPPGPAIPLASDRSDAYQLIASLARAQTGGATVMPSLYIGATDAPRYASVARDIYRFTPAIWSIDDIARVMGPQEHLSRSNLERMIGFYEDLMGEAAG